MRFLLLALTLSISFSLSAQFYGAVPDGQFRSNATAILKVAPDQVELIFGITLRDDDLLKGKQKSFSVISDAIDFCKQQGIEAKYIQTSHININPSYSYTKLNGPEYYNISQDFSVLLTNVQQYEAILTGLLERGVNTVRKVQFKNSNIEENRQKVRKMAIEAAKKKANFLASEVDLTLGKIVNLSETTNSNAQNYWDVRANTAQNVVQMDAPSDNGASLSLGLISYRSTVTLLYEIK